MTASGDGCEGSKTSGQPEPNPRGVILLEAETLLLLTDGNEVDVEEDELPVVAAVAAAKVSWAAES